MYSQLDIYLAEVPFSNLANKKIRPVVIISNDEFNKYNDLICCPITSNLRDYRHGIKIHSMDLAENSLKFRSKIKVNKIFTLEKKLFIKKLDSYLNKELILKNLNKIIN